MTIRWRPRIGIGLLHGTAVVIVAMAGVVSSGPASAQSPSPSLSPASSSPSLSPASSSPSPSSPAPVAPAAGPLSATLQGSARADYEAARHDLAERDFAAALARFTRAYQRVPDPRLLANIALCEQSLNHCARATELFEDALTTGSALFSPAQISEIRSRIEACRPPVAPAPIVRDGALTVRAGPGDRIALDGRVVAEGSWDARVPIGTHALAVTAEGMLPFGASVVVEENQTHTFDVTLEPDRRAPTWLWVTGGVIAAATVVVAAAAVFRASDPTPPPTLGVATPLRVTGP
jgi:hypothetical protein